MKTKLLLFQFLTFIIYSFVFLRGCKKSLFQVGGRINDGSSCKQDAQMALSDFMLNIHFNNKMHNTKKVRMHTTLWSFLFGTEKHVMPFRASESHAFS